MVEKPAIAGGRPVRRNLLPFYRPFIGEQEKKAVEKVLTSGWLISGGVTGKFEDEFRKYIGCKFALAVNSCTSGLHLSLAAGGIKAKDEVLTAPFTFAATANVIVHRGAKPIFADIDKETLKISPESIAKKISSKTKAILPVHIGGLPCRIDEILAIARKKNIKVFEDAAHAVGSIYKNKKIGRWGDATVFSFHAVKNITTAEGGMITTDNQRLAQQLSILRLHGLDKDSWSREKTLHPWKYKVLEAGYKCNLNDVLSAIGVEQLKRLDSFLDIRTKYAKIYDRGLQDIEEIELPTRPAFGKHPWHLYIIKLKIERLRIDRDRFIEALRKENIATSVHFIPLHLHPFYQKNFGYKKGDFPNSEWAYQRVISLPLYPKMTGKDLQDVIIAVRKIIRYYRR